MNPDQQFQAAIQQQIVWKNYEVRSFAVSLIRHALMLATFTTDIVPDAERGNGTGIAGTCIEVLRTAGLIEPVGIIQGGTFYQHRIKSTRPGRNGAWINVYQLTSIALAHEFLRRNGIAPVLKQTQLSW